jgi:hypothetical protein
MKVVVKTSQECVLSRPFVHTLAEVTENESILLYKRFLPELLNVISKVLLSFDSETFDNLVNHASQRRKKARRATATEFLPTRAWQPLYLQPPIDNKTETSGTMKAEKVA